MEIREPSEIRIGTRVFVSPPKCRPMDPRLDVGTVVDLGAIEGMFWVELTGLDGKRIRTPRSGDSLEAIG